MEGYISVQGSYISTQGNMSFLKNKALITKTKQIFNALNETKKSTLKVARLLSEVEEKEMYTQDGYESVIDYAANLFGFKNNYTYKLLKIAPFVNPDFTTIYDTDNGGSYTAGQLIECSPLTVEQREEHINHDITADMTTKEIREQVKIILNPVSEGEDSGEDNGKDNAIIGKVSKSTASYLKKIAALIEDINGNGTISIENLNPTGASVIFTYDENGADIEISYNKKEGNE